MIREEKRVAMVIFLLLIVAMISVRFFYFKKKIISEKNLIDIPFIINDWKSKDIPMAERTYEILETKDVLFREYSKGIGHSVYLCIVYSKDNRKVSHPPEVCYEGGGSMVLSKSIEYISLLKGGFFKANKLIVQRGNKKEVVIYWYKAGNKDTISYYKQQWYIVLNRIWERNGSSSGALIRFSSPILNNNEEETIVLMRKFIAEVIPILNEYLI
ncbi:EpsI family protein [bacterium]|nr:EpsI family protein [bacterium]